MTKILILALATCALAACSGGGSGSFKRASVSDRLAPVIQYGATDGFGSTGVHTVAMGETLVGIARAYRLLPGDLLAANALTAYVRLRPGMRLEIPPPKAYTVKSGENVFQIARLFGLSPLDLIATNGLRAPYHVRVGQKLDLPRPVLEPEPMIAANEPVAAPRDQVIREVLAAPSPAAPIVQTQQVASLGRGGMMVIPPSKPSVTKASLAPSAEPLSFPPMRDSGRSFLKPVQGSVVSGYGPKKDGRVNEGINIAAPKGSPVRAARDATVVYVGDAVEGYGNLILLKHAGGYITAYAHLDRTLVREGQTVKRGTVIGTVGSTGNVDRAQLHFEIRKGRETIDPKRMI
jgi:murein DD-endopeptidase MepM/ murein hydrolase activator NlpD